MGSRTWCRVTFRRTQSSRCEVDGGDGREEVVRQNVGGRRVWEECGVLETKDRDTTRGTGGCGVSGRDPGATTWTRPSRRTEDERSVGPRTCERPCVCVLCTPVTLWSLVIGCPSYFLLSRWRPTLTVLREMKIFVNHKRYRTKILFFIHDQGQSTLTVHLPRSRTPRTGSDGGTHVVPSWTPRWSRSRPGLRRPRGDSRLFRSLWGMAACLSFRPVPGRYRTFWVVS